MDIPSGADSGLDENERVIDRSGDIDQRPPEERGSNGAARIVALYPRREFAVPATVPVASPERLQAQPARLAETAQRLQKDLDKQYAKSKSQLEGLSQKIEVQEKRCIAPKLDDDLQQIRFQRQKVLIANGPALADKLREERNRVADFEHFKMTNGLIRDAHYPESQILGLGILFALILAEAAINGVVFADSSDQGLFGGWLEALVLSIANVGAAFLFGRVLLSQLHRRNAVLKAGAFAISIAGVAALLAINLFGAHYRDFRAAGAPTDPPAAVTLKPENNGSIQGSKPAPRFAVKKSKAEAAEPLPPRNPAALDKAKEREAIKAVFEAPFAFSGFMSVFLFVIGLCGAAIAAIDGYKFDDPFPSYGKFHRRYKKAREETADALRRVLGQSNGIMTGSFKAIDRKLDGFAQEMASLLTLHHAFASDLKTLKDSLEEAVRDAEAELAANERLAAKVRDPGLRDLYAFSVKQLPSMSEKQVKFYETQDRKLKALQKGVQKEQNDVLGVFDAASADFQRLLAEASQASLEAAGSRAPASIDSTL